MFRLIVHGLGKTYGCGFVLSAALFAACDATVYEPSDLCGAPEIGEPGEMGTGALGGMGGASMIDWSAALDRALPCEDAPELCELPVESTIAEPDLELAIDVVFVSDGYTSIERFRERARELMIALFADEEGIVGRDPSLFNFHRVELVAPAPSAEARPLRSCVYRDAPPFDDGSYFLRSDDLRLLRAAKSAPDVDVAIVLVAGSSNARGNAGGFLGVPIIHLPHETTPRTLTHEMGHALIGLADEYVDFDARHYSADLFERWTRDPIVAPNLSLSADEDWDGAVDGAIEGGGRFARGVYRPTNDCRMRDSYAHNEFCPVCSAAVDEMLSARRGLEDGPPRCGVAVGPEVAGSRQVSFFGRDSNGILTFELTLDGNTSPPLDAALLGRAGPVWFEVESSTSTDDPIRIRCTDTIGESSESVLDD